MHKIKWKNEEFNKPVVYSDGQKKIKTQDDLTNQHDKHKYKTRTHMPARGWSLVNKHMKMAHISEGFYGL